MTATTLLHEARAAGVTLTATADGKLRWRCRGPLPADLGSALAAHRPQLLALLTWNQGDPDRLVALCLTRLEAVGWPADAGARQQLGLAMDDIDAAFLGRRLDALRRAVDAFLVLLPGDAIENDAE
jgi:hypothetical protein